MDNIVDIAKGARDRAAAEAANRGPIELDYRIVFAGEMVDGTDTPALQDVVVRGFLAPSPVFLAVCSDKGGPAPVFEIIVPIDRLYYVTRMDAPQAA